MRSSLPVAALVVALVAVALVASLRPAEAKRDSALHSHVVEITSVSDFADVLLADVTVADSAPAATLSSVTAVTCAQAVSVGADLRFAGASDSATIQPIFYDADGAIIRVGDAVEILAGSSTDAASLYLSDGTVWWNLAGATTVKFRVTAVGAGTIKAIYAGTR